MKLIVDTEINATIFAEAEYSAQFPHIKALAYLLSHAKISHIAMPLEAKVCEDFILRPTPDYPIAALSATAEKFELDNAYWLRADPVYLVMQRDAFSLHDEVPVPVSLNQAEALLKTLNQHFKVDGLQFIVGKSGAWYLKVPRDFISNFPVSTTLPQVAVGKNVHSFMPQGLAAQKWRTILNEIQMLLFEHPVNLALESAGQLTINSLWLSGGGTMPNQEKLSIDDLFILSNSPFYEGLAHFMGVTYAKIPISFEKFMQENVVNARIDLPIKNTQIAFEIFLKLLKSKKISALTLNIGCYEQTLVANILPRDLYKFWRKIKPLHDFFEH